MLRIALLLLLGVALQAQPFEQQWQQFKKQLSNDELYRLLWALPKGGDIHVHHEYSVPMRFWIDGASRNGYYTRVRLSGCTEAEPPLQWLTLRKESVAKLSPCQQADFEPAANVTAGQRREWLDGLTLTAGEARDEFFERIVQRLGDLEKDPQLMADALLVAQRQLQAQHAIYLETQLDPRGFHGLNDTQAAAFIRRRLARLESVKTGVAVRMQLSTVRFLPDAEADLKDAFAFVHANHDLWKGTNLVGREDNAAGNPARFAPLLAGLRKRYPDVALSLHAGESREADTHVAETLDMGALRIGHGINAYRDPRAMQLLRSGRYLIEINLVSNFALGYTPDLTTHPFPRYLRAHIPVCLNTDDGGILDSNLTDEYFAAVALYDLTWEEVVRLGHDSLAYSFAEPSLKAALLKRYAASVAAFERNAVSLIGKTRAEPSGMTPRLLHLRKP